MKTIGEGRILAGADDRGGGFCVSDDLVVTAGHVVRGQPLSRLCYRDSSDVDVPVQQVVLDERWDLALLHLGRPARVVAGLTTAHPGVRWSVTARPRGNDPQLTGTVTQPCRTIINASEHEIQVMQLHVDQLLGDHKGYSGSPVWVGGAVAGVLVEQVRDRAAGAARSTNVMYAVAIATALACFDLDLPVAISIDTNPRLEDADAGYTADTVAAVGKLPADIAAMMERLGRHHIDPIHSGVDEGEIWIVLFPLLEFWQRDSDGFVSALLKAIRPVGGWALYGAAHTVKEVLGVEHDSTACRELMSLSLDFLRSRGVPNLMLRPYEWRFWAETKGIQEQWLTGRPKPAPSEAPIIDLGRREARRIAQVVTGYDSPAVFVRRGSEQRYIALIEVRNGDAYPRRIMHEWKGADTLNDLYWEVGCSYQVPTYWYHSELAPYFPLPPPRLD